MKQKNKVELPEDFPEKEHLAHLKRESSIDIVRSLTIFIALCWSLFQLATASVLLLNTVYIRAIHLGFAITLVFLNIPLIKRPFYDQEKARFLPVITRVNILDYMFAILGAFAALYIVIDYIGISARSGLPTTRDLVFGLILIILLLEATRRALGPALPCIATVFIAYVFLGPYLPDFLAFKGASITRFIAQMTMDTEGIYGVPLHVSSTVVFLFVLFGTMLDRAGGGNFFIQLALSGLGRYKGGAAKAAVFGSALTGVVSGSSIANVVTTGTFTIPLMKKMGYPGHKAAAVEVAASINGQITPPVMGAAAFIIAEYVNVPYVEVAKAAAIPAFAAYAALLWITHIEASKLGLKGLPKSEVPNTRSILREGAHFLIPIVMLLYELVILQHSAELSVCRAIAVLSVIMLGQPIIVAHLKHENLWQAAKSSIKQYFLALAAGATNMTTVAMATASAGIIVGCVSLGLGQQITSFVEILSMGNLPLLLIITAMASLLLGMGLPTTANYIIMASLTAPILVHLASSITIHGIQLAVPLIAAHLYCLYFGVMADATPPVGLAAYAGAAIANSSPIKTGITGFLYDIPTGILPFMFIFNHDILLWNVSNIFQAFFIFFMTCIGTCSFASLTQRWFITKTNPFEMLILAFTTIIMLNPFMITGLFLPFELRYVGYAIGIIALTFIGIMQKNRIASQEASA